MSDEPMPSSERIAKLSAALDLDIAKLGAGAANGFAVGDEVMLPGELRAVLKAAQWAPDNETVRGALVKMARRLAVAEGLLREVEWSTDFFDGKLYCHYCQLCRWVNKHSPDCRLGAFLAPVPATPATADEVSE